MVDMISMVNQLLMDPSDTVSAFVRVKNVNYCLYDILVADIMIFLMLLKVVG